MFELSVSDIALRNSKIIKRSWMEYLLKLKLSILPNVVESSLSIGSDRAEELIMKKYLSYSLMCLILIISRGIQAKTTQAYIVGAGQVDYVQCEDSGWDSTKKNTDDTMTYNHACKAVSVKKGNKIATTNGNLDCPDDTPVALYIVYSSRGTPHISFRMCDYPNNLIRTPFSLEGKSKWQN